MGARTQDCLLHRMRPGPARGKLQCLRGDAAIFQHRFGITSDASNHHLSGSALARSTLSGRGSSRTRAHARACARTCTRTRLRAHMHTHAHAWALARARARANPRGIHLIHLPHTPSLLLPSLPLVVKLHQGRACRHVWTLE
jgi:hypothetical protein